MPRLAHNRTDRDTEDRIVAGYLGGKNTPELGRLFGISKPTVAKILKRKGVPTRPATSRRFVTINEEAFATINEESAYWIGFLMADGCVTDGRGPNGAKCITLRLALIDGDHVRAFARFLNYGGKVTEHTNQLGYKGVYVSVASNRLAADLASYGVVPRKSNVAKVIGLEMDRHFWRGVIDGDGCVRRLKQNRIKPQLPIIQFCGSKDIVEQFLAFARLVEPAVRSNCSVARGNHYHTSITGYAAWSVILSLYSDCTVSLPRKLHVACEILSEPQPESYFKWEYLTREYLETMRARHSSWEGVAKELGINPETLRAIRHRRGWTLTRSQAARRRCL
jgi:hypothetical protein